MQPPSDATLILSKTEFILHHCAIMANISKGPADNQMETGKKWRKQGNEKKNKDMEIIKYILAGKWAVYGNFQDTVHLF